MQSRTFRAVSQTMELAAGDRDLVRTAVDFILRLDLAARRGYERPGVSRGNQAEKEILRRDQHVRADPLILVVQCELRQNVGAGVRGRRPRQLLRPSGGE